MSVYSRKKAPIHIFVNLQKKRRRPSLDSSEDDNSDEEVATFKPTTRLGEYFAGPCKAAGHAAEQAEEFVKKVWAAGWRVVHHHSLPDWLQDNDFLHNHHRPPTHSFLVCFKSIFRIHTETGNIWTHLLGECVLSVLSLLRILFKVFSRLQLASANYVAALTSRDSIL